VHHGGAGTTAAGLLAGRPSLACPFFGDQPFWGDLLHRQGVGPAPIAQRELSTARLAEALQGLVNHAPYRQSAALWAQQLAQEDGCAGAVQLLEQDWGYSLSSSK
jgi:sterol 3beta-glucosyltransferase